MTAANRAVLALITWLFIGALPASAAQPAVVFYLDKNGYPVTRLDRVKPLPDGLRAILAMYALQAGAGCNQRSPSNGILCELTTSLGLGEQCSSEHVALVRRWFKRDIPDLGVGPYSELKEPQKSGGLERVCYDTPDTATAQKFWEVIKVTRNDDRVVIDSVQGRVTRDAEARFTYRSEYRLATEGIETVSNVERTTMLRYK